MTFIYNNNIKFLHHLKVLGKSIPRNSYLVLLFLTRLTEYVSNISIVTAFTLIPLILWNTGSNWFLSFQLLRQPGIHRMTG